jgi:hypothetical protein
MTMRRFISELSLRRTTVRSVPAMIPGSCEDRMEAGRRPREAILHPTRDGNPQHPHDLSTTSPLLWPTIAGMQANEATLAPTTQGRSERPERAGSATADGRAQRERRRPATAAPNHPPDLMMFTVLPGAMSPVADAREVA